MEVRSIETIIQALNTAKVEYLIVGGLAVGAHGYDRLTADVDLVIGLQPKNITLGLRALLAAGWRMSIPVTPEDFAKPQLREQWRREKDMIVLKLWSDVHPRTPVDVFVYEPFDFKKELSRAKWERVAGKTRAPIICYKTLLAMKKTAGRDKDLLDIKALKKLDPYR
jgi:hypothetical protein